MAKQHTVDVMKELGTLQPPELVGVKQEISPDSEVPPELSVGEVTESSKTNETPLKTCVDVIMQHMKTLVEQLEKSQGIIEKRLKSVEEQLGKDQGVIEKRLKSVEEQLGKDQGVIKKHLKSVEEQLGKDGVIEKRLKSVEEQLGKDQGVIEKQLKSVEKRLEAVESSLPKRSQGVQPNMSLNNKDANGYTPLVNAARNNDIVRTGVLLKMGADVNIADSGWFPLHYAAGNGFTEVCALLILVGNADLNSKINICNETPLHLAAARGYTKVVELLLTFGADVNLKNSIGKTAYDLAVGKNRNEIARLLGCAINKDMFTSLLNQPLKK